MKKQYAKPSVDTIKMSKEEMSEDLEKEIHNQAMKLHTAPTYEELRNFALHFVEWQKEQDQKTIELAEDHAMLAGMERMKEEMLKDAVDATIAHYYSRGDGSATGRVIFCTDSLRDFKTQDKVKLIIVKEG